MIFLVPRWNISTYYHKGFSNSVSKKRRFTSNCKSKTFKISFRSYSRSRKLFFRKWKSR